LREIFFESSSGFSQHNKHALARGELTVERIELFTALGFESAGEAEVIAILAGTLFYLVWLDRARVLLHDADHNAAKVIGFAAHHFERELAREVEQRV
jgi:hypothetical protein